VAVDRTERLLNLVLCLLGTQRPVPRAILRTAVPGYPSAASDEAFERMFERDKEELRGMGVPVETVITSAGEVEGYRIDASDYAMPELTFTAEELTVLGLAARAWSDAALSTTAMAALRKVEAVAGSRGELPGAAWRGAAAPEGESELPALWAAIRTRQRVTFDYRALGEVQATRREVEPWATVRWQGAWYLAAWSPERGAERVYRLSRISGAVRVVDHTFDPVDPGDVRALVAQLASPEPSGTAVVHLPPDRGASVRLRGTLRPDGLIEVPYVAGDRVVAEVLAGGGVIVGPEELRTAASEAMVRVIEAHTDRDSDA